MESYSLKWNLHLDHLEKVVNDMFMFNHLTDVTIACDDQKMVNAHKFILSGSSTIFKDIIDSLSENDSVIDLRNFQSEDMESILKFLYTGKVTFPQSRSESFLNVARYLDIKEIYTIFDINNVAEIHYEDIVTLDVITADDVQITAEENGITEKTYAEEEANSENQAVASSDSKQCEFCSLDFETDSHLNKHLRLDHRIYMCTFENCEYFFEKQMNDKYEAARKKMKQHISSVHPQSRKYSCPIEKCDFVTEKEKRLMKHCMEHRIYNCKFCDEKFTIKANLRQHTNVKHFLNCTKEEKFEVAVNQNKKIILQTNALQCTDCHTVFEGREDFNFHKQNVHGKYPCIVDDCDYIPQGRKALDVHNSTKHLQPSVERSYYECKDCTIRFTYKSSLETHIQQTHGTYCKECDYKAENSLDLIIHSDRHLAANMSIGSDGTWMCSKCPKVSKKKTQMKEHVESHIEGLLFQCPHCDKTTRSRSTLRKHTRWHE